MKENIGVKFRRTGAVFKKQIKDILKNKMLLFQFLLFPAMALILTLVMPEGDGPDAIPKGMFALMFSPMFAGMMPIVTMAAVIGEEKEKKSLKVLAMSGVTPMEYLVGTGGFVLLFSIPAIFIFGITALLSIPDFLIFFCAMTLGVIVGTILGGAAGLLSKNQVNATAIAMPFAMILAFIPMIAMFSGEGAFKTIADMLFTQQIGNIISDFSDIKFVSFAIIGINLVVSLAFFIFAYKKGNLSE